MITTEEFIKAWNSAYKNGRTRARLARDLHVHDSTVRKREKWLRNHGVNLPELQRYTLSDSELLNKMVNSSEHDNLAKDVEDIFDAAIVDRDEQYPMVDKEKFLSRLFVYLAERDGKVLEHGRQIGASES